MSTLTTFPPPPPEGQVTVCEQNADLVAVAKCDLEKTQNIQGIAYPEVDVTSDSHKRSFLKESARSAFVEHEETSRKRLIRAWYEHGLNGVLEELAADSNANDKYKWVSSSCRQILGLVRWVTYWHGSLFSHLSMPNEDLAAEFSTNMNWKISPVRHFAWHPHTTKFAVALRDESIKVYTMKKTDIVPTLKHKLQKNVADLAWKPLSASLLAVACQSCTLVWNVDPNSLATRPSVSAAQVLRRSGHSPVTSLAWDPQGSLLATASPTDTSILVWDVSMETCVPLHRFGGGGVCSLRWSPEGSKLLSMCPSPVFRVWETLRWTCEKWVKLSGRVQSACWSPDGSVLLFCTTEEPIIYYLTFSHHAKEGDIGGSKAAINVADLSSVELGEVGLESVRVGGPIQSIAWDPTGERLAVSFKEPQADYIALFQTRLEPSLELIPCGFVRGLPGEIPNQLSFQPNFSDGAVLTVVWSTGRISYLPLYYVTRQHLNPGRLYQHTGSNGAANAKTQLYSD